MTLVHAVQQPVEPPSILSFVPIKLRDRTFAYVRAQVRVHGASTGELELVASWKEKTDDGSAPPSDLQREAQLFSSRLSLPLGEVVNPVAPAVDDSVPAGSFDAATNLVDYRAPAIEAFDESLHSLARELSATLVEVRRRLRLLRPPAPHLTSEVAKLGRASVMVNRNPLEARWPELVIAAEEVAAEAEALEPDPDVPDAENVPIDIFNLISEIASFNRQIAVKARAGIRGLDRHLGRHEFGDTKYRSVSYRAIGTSRFGECFATTTGEAILPATRESEAVTVDILSSAPPPPGVQYVVPTFSWARTTRPGTQEERSEKRGGGLRVYLDRPWFCSGDGELLGVVLGSHPDVGQIATRCGRDPIWRSAGTSSFPAATDFRNAIQGVGSADLVAFPVDFDEKGRCFCDIEVNTGLSYFPFLRLALARLQSKSVPGIERSTVVLADFVQLAPDRAVTITRQSPDVFGVRVSGRTHDSLTNPLELGEQRGTRVRVSVQHGIPGTTDDAGWLPSTDGTIVAPQVEAADGEILWTGTVTMPAQRPG